MIRKLSRKVFGTANERYIRSVQPLVNKINAFEQMLEPLSDDDLSAKTLDFRRRLSDGETLEGILPEAFAVAREAAKRTLGQRHYDVQLVGGIALHRGRIAEMKTGEGKTLVAVLSVYLNALEGKGVHVITVNDYLARRDSEWMGRVYRFLGLSVGCITNELDDRQRKDAYACDITYGTNNEFGFDYLRDNMKFSLDQMVQRPFNYAIVDEVDSILIDEARTPLIISGLSSESSERYETVNRLIPQLTPLHYEIEEKDKKCTLTELGLVKIEELLRSTGILKEGGLYDFNNIALMHYIEQALLAHKLFNRDVQYIVKDGKIVIIDEFTGRMMDGRRYSDGLHQAIEAKEGVKIQAENQTLASITFQNYFRMYPKLAGMTGTAMTEAAEFEDIYNLGVVSIATHRPQVRKDHDDEIYCTVDEKYTAIMDLVQQVHARRQPVLIGTVSIEKSELLADMLKRRLPSAKFQILNARHHEKEASIIAQAGVPGAITIATNMAGRGTDIQLGGNLEMRIKHEIPEDLSPQDRARRIEEITREVQQEKQVAINAGGLYIMGTERHESRRIDNQLRGRSGRQGDPGESKFFLSLQDDLMRIFGMEKLNPILKTLRIKTGEAITHRWVSGALAKAQAKVEALHFEIRKNLLKFDNVMNEQRKIIYDLRKDMMTSADVSASVSEMRQIMVEDLVARYAGSRMNDDWDLDGLSKELARTFNIMLPLGDLTEDLAGAIYKAVEEKFADKEQRFTTEIMREVEKSVVLQTLDQVWKEHLQSLDYMRHSIGLRSYGQKDPLNEYKKESFLAFKTMLDVFRQRAVQMLSFVEIMPGSDISGDIEDSGTAMAPGHVEKVGRNEKCPCGSGKKYKHCHGAI